MITSKTIFSHGVFQLTVELEDIYRDLKIDSVELYEFAPQNGYDTDPYILLDSENYDGPTQLADPQKGFTVKYKFTDKTDRLLKWVVRINPTIETQSGSRMIGLPCCAVEDEKGFYVFEGYSVDLTQYKLGILETINLQCNGCEVPRELLNKLLKLFAVEAAVQSKSPYTEMIFSKVACKNSAYPRLVNSFSRNKNCNCNG